MKINKSKISVFVFFLIWEILGKFINITYILPIPSLILKKIWILKKVLFFVHLPATLSIAIISLFITIFIGITLAICMDFSVTLYECIYPLIVGSQTIP
ncbi:MAG: hypothetical protein ACRC4S_06955, partial [Cetobacterium sp.]